MSEPKKSIIEVQGTAITVLSKTDEDYISLTDIARYRNSLEPFAVINNWMRSRSTIEFLGLWEKLSNPDFKPLEFERFRNEAGSNYTENCLDLGRYGFWTLCNGPPFIVTAISSSSFRQSLSRNPAGPPPAFGLFERRALTLKSDKMNEQ